jgi:plastocyanin
MKAKIRALSAGLLILVVGLVLVGCGGSGTTTSMSMASTSMGSTPTTAAATSGTSVSLANIAISPTSLTINAGQSVTWTNNDSVTHHLVGDKGEFDSGDMAPGAKFTFTFKTAGSVNYHCTIHPSMTGTIVVK